MRRSPHRHSRTTAFALTAVLFWACAPEQRIEEVRLGAEDFAFMLADTLAGGLVRFAFVNDGEEDHHAQFLRLNDGVTRAQYDSTFIEVLKAVEAEGDVAYMRLLEIVTVAGGPALVAPGGRMTLTTDLVPGEYLVVCFVPSSDGVPHLAKGMRRWLTVTEPVTESSGPPEAAGRVDMADFAFTDLTALNGGRTVLEVSNSGREPHEMLVVRLEGISLDQFLTMFMSPPPAEGAPAGPPPFRFVGGLQAVMPGARAWVTLDLSPGEYALICLIPSPANQGRLHAELGMVRTFTIG